MNNQLKTVMLLAALTAVFLWVGSFFGGPTGLIIAIVFVVLFNLGSYLFSDKIVLAMYKAKPAEDNSELVKIVRDVSRLANIPMPKVYIIPSKSPNAFATGRGPKNSAVAATEGILELLTKDELKGVMAHEIAHIKNRDTLIQTITGMIAGVISYVAVMARWGAIFGGFGGRDDDSGGLLELLVLAIIAPITATIIQLAISRSREYMADEGAARTLHSGLSLASALEKLEKGIKHDPMKIGNTSTAHLFIANPFKGKDILHIFSTHPSTEKRVARLRDMRF